MQDSYYVDQSNKAIDAAIREAESQPPDAVRKIIRRSYPFGPIKEGRAYRIWRRVLLQREKELGMEPKRHAKNMQSEDES